MKLLILENNLIPISLEFTNEIRFALTKTLMNLA